MDIKTKLQELFLRVHELSLNGVVEFPSSGIKIVRENDSTLFFGKRVYFNITVGELSTYLSATSWYKQELSTKYKDTWYGVKKPYIVKREVFDYFKISFGLHIRADYSESEMDYIYEEMGNHIRNKELIDQNRELEILDQLLQKL